MFYDVWLVTPSTCLTYSSGWETVASTSRRRWTLGKTCSCSIWNVPKGFQKRRHAWGFINIRLCMVFVTRCISFYCTATILFLNHHGGLRKLFAEPWNTKMLEMKRKPKMLTGNTRMPWVMRVGKGNLGEVEVEAAPGGVAAAAAGAKRLRTQKKTRKVLLLSPMLSRVQPWKDQAHAKMMMMMMMMMTTPLRHPSQKLQKKRKIRKILKKTPRCKLWYTLSPCRCPTLAMGNISLSCACTHRYKKTLRTWRALLQETKAWSSLTKRLSEQRRTFLRCRRVCSWVSCQFDDAISQCSLSQSFLIPGASPWNHLTVPTMSPNNPPRLGFCLGLTVRYVKIHLYQSIWSDVTQVQIPHEVQARWILCWPSQRQHCQSCQPGLWAVIEGWVNLLGYARILFNLSPKEVEQICGSTIYALFFGALSLNPGVPLSCKKCLSQTLVSVPGWQNPEEGRWNLLGQVWWTGHIAWCPTLFLKYQLENIWEYITIDLELYHIVPFSTHILYQSWLLPDPEVGSRQKNCSLGGGRLPRWPRNPRGWRW